MKGDFSRLTFDPNNNFLRVLMQQGRVQLDADWNEQISILLHSMQTLVVDLIGPHAGAEQTSFQISWAAREKKFFIGEGHYYVNGFLCVNDKARPLAVDDLKAETSYLVYLDVWEAHLTSIQDESIREVALGVPDTTTRSKVMWQAKVWENLTEADLPPDVAVDCDSLNSNWEEVVKKLWKTDDRGKLIATLAQQPVSTDPCAISPKSRYRGLENQLYRVEIHKGGSSGEATFKWSRDNGSVVFPIDTLAENVATLKEMGYDDRFTLAKGDWVEIIDDDYDLTKDNPIFKVEYVDPLARQVRLDLRDQETPAIEAGSDKHPFLRRWDHQASYDANGKPNANGAIEIIDDPLDLENNIQIQFKHEAETIYQAGDYWLIPARTATGDIEWPKNSKGEPPKGVDHYYAPLAIINKWGSDPEDDCRRIINTLTGPPTQPAEAEEVDS